MTNDHTVIVLSAGYFGFFAHAGFMRAVEELQIDYRAIAGSSAGAIVAALHASGVPATEIVERLTALRKNDFWDSTGATGIVRALVNKGRGWSGLLKGERFERLLESHLRVRTFEECEKRLYLTAFNLTRGADETFTTGTIADKVRASCSYPFLMSPRTIAGNEYWDGGFLAKVPLEGLLEHERPSRVLIHYLPTRPAKEEARSLQDRNWTAFAMLEKALTAARKEIERHRIQALAEIGDRLIWVEPAVRSLSAATLAQSGEVVDAAYRHALQELSRL